MSRKKLGTARRKSFKWSQKRKQKRSWVKLPYTALVKVMENLNDPERVKTAQVCQSWNDALLNPSLWRSRHFDFGGPKANASGKNALAFVETKGSFLRKVSITCRHITSNTCEMITSTLEPFSAHVARADLEEFRMSGLELDRFWKYAHLRVKVAECLSHMLQGKKRLTTLEMSLAQFGLLPGTDLLATVSEACGDTLTHLLLHDFFHSRLAVFELERFRTVLHSFRNLQEVSLNYCCMYDDLLTVWATSLRGKLTSLRIKACDNEPHDHVISDLSWRALASACPGLCVDLSVVGIGPASSLVPILAPPAPVTSLHIWSGYDNDLPLQLSSTLHHIASHLSHRIRRLHLDFDNYQDDIDDALIRLVTQCTNLTHLQVKANSSVSVAHTVCQLVRERRTQLESVDIMLCDMADPDMEHLTALREEMAPLAQERGISLVLHSDLF